LGEGLEVVHFGMETIRERGILCFLKSKGMIERGDMNDMFWSFTIDTYELEGDEELRM
jgi:hypothetical protein